MVIAVAPGAPMVAPAALDNATETVSGRLVHAVHHDRDGDRLGAAAGRSGGERHGAGYRRVVRALRRRPGRRDSSAPSGRRYSQAKRRRINPDDSGVRCLKVNRRD